MKTKQTTRFLLMLLIAALAVMVPQFAAASTAPCTTITNLATANYSVGGIGQTPENSNTTTFDVGVKVIVTVTNNDGDEVTVVPGTTKVALKFTVTNDGNAVHDYDLTAEASADTTPSPYDGADDSFDGTTIAIYDDTGGTPGSFDATDSVITSLDDVAADGGSAVVYIVYTPSDLSEDDLETAVYYLMATSKWADDAAISYGTDSPEASEAGGSCDGATSVDVVAGDGDGDATGDDDKDGEHSDDGAFEVSSAIIGVTKSQSVIWDPVNYNSSPAFIPGAIVEYEIEIANTGGAAAVLTTITDALQVANLTLVSTFYDGSLGTDTPTSSSGEAFVVTCTAPCGTRACESAGYTFTALTADGIVFSTPTITATMATVLPSEDSCPVGQIDATTGVVTIKFQATIN